MPNGQLLVDGVALPEPDYPDIDSLNLDTSDYPFCFLAGTAISTPDGEVAVETLSIGTPTLTFDGRVVPLQWIGHQTVHKLFSGPNVQPVRIRAGALGEGLPRADLTVTADHGMILDGHVINASALVNGQSINWVPPSDLPGRFTPSTMSRPRNMT